MKDDILANYVNCPLCGEDRPHFVRRVKSLYSEDYFNLVRCGECGLMYINPWEDWNRKEGKLKLRKMDLGFKESELKEVTTYDQIWRELEVLKSPGRILDIGCAAGGFLRRASSEGWDLFGVEINQSIAEHASEQYGIRIFGGTIQEAAFPPDYFDVVITINTLEHIHQPVPFVQEIYRILKPGGVFYVMTPNYNNHIVRIAQKFGFLQGVDPIDPTGHPCLYSDFTLKLLLTKVGFKLVSLHSGMTGNILIKHDFGGKLSGLWTKRLFRSCFSFMSEIIRGGSTLRSWAVKK